MVRARSSGWRGRSPGRRGWRAHDARRSSWPVAHPKARSVSAFGAQPEDSTTHVETWDALVAMLGSPQFTYVVDCKLATRDNMDHIAGKSGRFLTILPRTRKEDGIGRAWIASGAVVWEEIARRPGQRKADPEEVYCAAEAPSCSQEGYRIVWIRSSDKQAHDATARAERVERTRAALGELDGALRSGRCRLKTKTAIEEAASAILAETRATRWVHAIVSETVEYEHR